MAFRVPCPTCQQKVAMTVRGRLARHGHRDGRPPCARSGRPVGRIWSTRHKGRRVVTIPGPDTWNPTPTRRSSMTDQSATEATEAADVARYGTGAGW